MNVLFLTTLPTLKACNSPYIQYYFKLSFVLHSSEVIFSFLIKKSRQKAIEIKIAFFIPLGIPRIAHWIIPFMLHIPAITSPTNWYLYRWVSWNISKVINENSLSAFNYLDDFSQGTYDDYYYMQLSQFQHWCEVSTWFYERFWTEKALLYGWTVILIFKLGYVHLIQLKFAKLSRSIWQKSVLEYISICAIMIIRCGIVSW